MCMCVWWWGQGRRVIIFHSLADDHDCHSVNKHSLRSSSLFLEELGREAEARQGVETGEKVPPVSGNFPCSAIIQASVSQLVLCQQKRWHDFYYTDEAVWFGGLVSGGHSIPWVRFDHTVSPVRLHQGTSKTGHTGIWEKQILVSKNMLFFSKIITDERQKVWEALISIYLPTGNYLVF